MGMIKSQTTALLNKALKKIQKYLSGIVEQHIEATHVLPQITNSNLNLNNNTSNKSMQAPFSELKEDLKRAGIRKKISERNEMIRNRKSKTLDDSLEVKKIKSDYKGKVLGHLQEYNISQFLNEGLINKNSGNNNEIPTSISIKTGEKMIDTPLKNSLNNKMSVSVNRDLSRIKNLKKNKKKFKKNKNKRNSFNNRRE